MDGSQVRSIERHPPLRFGHRVTHRIQGDDVVDGR